MQQPPNNSFYYYGSSPATQATLDALATSSGDISCDVETHSLTDKRLLGIGFATSPTDGFYIPVGSAHMTLAKELLVRPQRKVFNAGSFDLAALAEANITVNNYVDSLVGAQILGLEPSLPQLALRMFGEYKPPITDLIGKGKSAITMDKVPEELVAGRCCEDCVLTLRVWLKIEPDIPKAALDLDMALMPILVQMTARGMLIDQDLLAQRIVEATALPDTLRRTAASYGFNPGSSKQVATILKAHGYTISYDKTTGKPMLNKTRLSTYYAADPMTQLTLDYRTAVYRLTWLIKLRDKYLFPDGRIHPRFHQNVATTGRMSSSKPNAQNFRPEIRDLLIVRYGCWAEARDFSQIELRVMAYLSQDKRMLEIFASGGDIHSETAALLPSLSKLSAKAARDIAKIVNFAIPYGGDESTLHVRGGLPMDEATALMADHKQKFPGLHDYLQYQRKFVRDHGYNTTMMGRIRRFPLAQGEPGRLQAKAEREAINNPIQGGAAEIQKKAQVRWVAEPQINSIHDETYSETDHLIPDLDGLAPFDTPMSRSIGLNFSEYDEDHPMAHPLGLIKVKAA